MPHFHSRSLFFRTIYASFGVIIAAAALNIFIVPQNLYTGGLLGLCQLIRTILLPYLEPLPEGFDITGLLYFLVNVPIFLFTFRAVGRSFIVRTLLCTAFYSLMYSLIPIPATPIVDDPLTSCLLGGILTGVGSGMVLTSGFSGGGLEVVGVYMSKKGTGFTVGRFTMFFNFFLYGVFLFLFSPAVVIYSVIYNFATSLMLDRMHQQNIISQVLIFTKDQTPAIARAITGRLGRGVSYWNGYGGYTDQPVQVLCVCLSKYEMDDLRALVHAIDPHAFFITQEGVAVDGNFIRRVSD